MNTTALENLAVDDVWPCACAGAILHLSRLVRRRSHPVHRLHRRQGEHLRTAQATRTYEDAFFLRLFADVFPPCVFQIRVWSVGRTV